MGFKSGMSGSDLSFFNYIILTIGQIIAPLSCPCWSFLTVIGRTYCLGGLVFIFKSFRWLVSIGLSRAEARSVPCMHMLMWAQSRGNLPIPSALPSLLLSSSQILILSKRKLLAVPLYVGIMLIEAGIGVLNTIWPPSIPPALMADSTLPCGKLVSILTF